jgi:putative Mn2+ efflux pump MntP
LISTIASIDSLGDGVTLGLAGKPILDYAVPIAVAAVASTYLGLCFARRMPAAFGSRLEIVGGAVLIALGFRMLSI